jgi:hypothetical protein
MVAIALFVLSGVLFGLNSFRRERAVPQDGTSRADRTTTVLMLQAVCAAIGAIAVATVDMVTSVS